MAIENYIKLVDDRFNQSYLLDLLRDAKVKDYDQIAGGICRMLSVTWVVECLKAGAGTPDVVLRQMKANGPVYFQQIARNQQAYQNYFGDAELGNFGSMRTVLQLASANTRDVLQATQSSEMAVSAAEMPTALAYATGISSTTPHGTLISLRMTGGGHCIAAFEYQAVNGSTWYVFDPNYGVMQVDVSAGENLGGLLTDIWNAYAGMSMARAFPVA